MNMESYSKVYDELAQRLNALNTSLRNMTDKDQLKEAEIELNLITNTLKPLLKLINHHKKLKPKH